MMAESNHEPPDFRAFHQSIAAELNAAKDRVRQLIRDRHWLTDGEHKEAVLRSVISRHLPSSQVMGTGFIVAPETVSTQIDILIVDGDFPVLFREGDLMIVTPEGVRAIIEVKTSLRNAQLRLALEKLGRNVALCHPLQQTTVRHQCWAGLFVYEQEQCNHQEALKSLARAHAESQGRVNCLSLGDRDFFRYWSNEEDTQGIPEPMNGSFWRSYEMNDLAPSYFIGNLLNRVAPPNLRSYAWFPEIGGKEGHRRMQIAVGSDQPETCR